MLLLFLHAFSFNIRVKVGMNNPTAVNKHRYSVWFARGLKPWSLVLFGFKEI